MKKLVLAGLLLSSMVWAQQRPRLLGVSHIAVRVKDLTGARHFMETYSGIRKRSRSRRITPRCWVVACPRIR